MWTSNLAGLEPRSKNTPWGTRQGCLLPADARGTRVQEASDVVHTEVNLEAATSAELPAPALARARIRSTQLDICERDVIADLFAV